MTSAYALEEEGKAESLIRAATAGARTIVPLHRRDVGPAATGKAVDLGKTPRERPSNSVGGDHYLRCFLTV